MRDTMMARVGTRQGGRRVRASAVMAAAVMAGGGSAARATNYTLTVTDTVGTSSFNAALNFKNNGVASNPATDGGVDTYNTSGFALRTPAGTGSYTFGGASLEVDAGGRLLGKGTANASSGGSTITVGNLILNGGIADEANVSGDGSVLNLAGAITVNANSSLGALAGETLVVQSTISGTANLTFGNSSTPAITDAGQVILVGSLTNYSGAFNIAAGTLAFNQSASTSLANPVIGVGPLEQLGNNTLTLTNADAFGSLFVRAGTVTTTSTITSGGFASIGLSPGDNGTLNLPTGATFTNGTNDFNLADQGGTTAAAANNGTVNLTGGTLAVGRKIVMSQALAYAKNSHCSYCGSLFPDALSWPRRCPTCGNVTYLNPLPVAVVLLPVDAGLLLVRRTNAPQIGELALPGGFINVGETWQEGGARELREETGITLSPADLRLFDTRSASDGTLLVFGLAPHHRAADLPPFTPTDETSENVLMSGPDSLAFSTHTETANRWWQEL